MFKNFTICHFFFKLKGYPEAKRLSIKDDPLKHDVYL